MKSTCTHPDNKSEIRKYTYGQIHEDEVNFISFYLLLRYVIKEQFQKLRGGCEIVYNFDKS